MLHLLAVLTILLYSASAVLLLFGVSLRGESALPQRLARFGTVACRGGFVCLTGFVLYTLTQERVLTTPGDYLLWVAWGMEAVYEFLKLEYPIVRVFVSSITLLIFGSSSWLVHRELGGSPGAPDALLFVTHIVPALLAEVSLLLGFVVAAVFLLQSGRIKSKSIESLQVKAPSLTRLETLHRRLLFGGFVFMTLAVVTGSIRAASLGIPLLKGDVTTWSALGAWLLLFVLLHGSTALGWSARRVSVATLVGVPVFVAVLLLGVVVTGEMLHVPIVG